MAADSEAATEAVNDVALEAAAEETAGAAVANDASARTALGDQQPTDGTGGSRADRPAVDASGTGVTPAAPATGGAAVEAAAAPATAGLTAPAQAPAGAPQQQTDQARQQQTGQGGAGRARVPQVPGFARRDGAGLGKRDGKALRERTPRDLHGRLDLDPQRPDAVTAVRASNTGRLPDLVPIRVGRMAASPFAFLRGAAGLMAHDLAAGPVTGVGAQICGDAHAANFGLYGDARGRLVIDLNDFDETVYGPWEWDLKRLATSLVLAGREAGADEDTCRTAARDAAGAYRRTMRLLAKLPTAEAWNAIADEELVSHTDARDLLGTLERVSAKARRNTSARFAARATERTPDGRRRFVAAPPVLRPVSDVEAATVALALGDYLHTLPADRLPLLARYAVHDVAFRVVGTGSVGTRSYVVLLLDHRGEPLILQVKEARPSALLPHVSKVSLDPRWSPAYVPTAADVVSVADSDSAAHAEAVLGATAGGAGAGAVAGVAPGDSLVAAAHEGRRVVLGQKQIQVVSDQLLGWTTVDGRPYQVRQFRNRKGSVDPAALAAEQLDDYGRMTGALLARAHSHSADPRVIGGYCGKGEELDEAVAQYAVGYADRTEADHAHLVAAVRAGQIPAELGV
ncbi:DUF2252 domain-containing protein [Streptomyces sp. HSW2009]|uniref:DUF2252 domain-containing protein n=1 Tax=Streptomyces sp. HSW2009 TaxID=3142890 RepID=UPI0032F07880